MKNKLLVLLLFLSFFIAGCDMSPKPDVIPEESARPDRPIGGERDEHGCLGPAGYSWNEEAGACIREWELDENQRKASKIAVDHVGWVYATTVVGVDTARCPVCFVVHLEKGDGRSRIDVTLENWEIKEKSLTPDECEALGGYPVNIVGGITCPEGEKDIGKVTGFISPNICCLKSGSSVSAECENSGGTWLSEYDECEYAGREWCDSQGGTWHECESACRHDPEAEICTMQCVPVCKFTGEKPEPEPEPEDMPVTDYPYGLFVEYTGANIGSVRGSERIPFGIDNHNKIVSPGGSFDIAGKVGGCNANGTVNIKMGGNLGYAKSSKQWMFHLMLRPAINNYIWECGGMTMDHSMEEWDAPFVMPFDEGATLEMPGMIFKFTLQDIPLWPVPLVD